MFVRGTRKCVYCRKENFGKAIGSFLNNEGVRWEGYVDQNDSLSLISNKRVYLYIHAFTEKDFFIIASETYASAMIKELKQVAITDHNIEIIKNIRDIVYEIIEQYIEVDMYLHKIQKFHNLHYSQRCFIIGNGPSLRIMDLELFKNEIKFACNTIYALYTSKQWRPTYYCVTDGVFSKNRMSKKEELQALVAECEASFVNFMSECFQYRDDKDVKNLYYVKGKTEIDKKTGLPLFSEDCSKNIYCLYSGVKTLALRRNL